MRHIYMAENFFRVAVSGRFQGGGFIPGFMAVSWVGLKDLVSWAVSRAVS